MAYLDEDQDDAMSIGEAVRRRMEREHLAGREPVTPPAVVARAEDDAAGARDEMDRTAEERAELFRSTPTGPGSTFTGAPPADDDSPGIVTRRGEGPDPADEAADYLASYDMSALDALEPSAAESDRFVPLDMEPMAITAGPEAGMAQGADDADEGSIFSTEFATDEDPVLPGRARPEGAVGGQGPGGWADDDDPVLAGTESFDMVMPEEDPADALLALNGPNAEIYGEAADADPELPARPGAVMPSIDDESGFWGAAAEGEPEMPGSGPDPEAMMLDALEDDDPGGMGLAAPTAPEAEFGDMLSSKTPTMPGSDPRALDVGLPTESAINEARGWDVPRGILHALGSGLNAASGRSTTPFRSNAAPLEEARREGIASRLNTKGATELADRRAGAAAESAERLATIRREPTELEVSREARLAADAARDDELTGRRLDLTERGLEDRAASSEAERSERVARTTADSDISRAAQARLGAELDAMATSPRLRAVADAFREGIEGMSAEDVERIERSQLLRPFLNRDGGGGGGGGGGSRTADAIVAQYMAADPTMTEDQARARVAALGTSGARAELGRIATETRRGTEDASGGEEILPGVRAGIDLGTGEGRALRSRAATYRDGYRALGEVESLLDRYGAETIINPAIQAELQPAMVTLLAMVAQIQNTGVINPSERPLIEATLPDPSSLSGMTLGRVAGALRGWRSRLEGATSSLMETAGVDESGRSAGLSWLRSGNRSTPRESPRSAAPAAGETVRVRLPDGRTGRIPRADYEAHASEMELVE